MEETNSLRSREEDRGGETDVAVRVCRVDNVKLGPCAVGGFTMTRKRNYM